MQNLKEQIFQAFSIKPKRPDPHRLLKNQYKLVRLFSGNLNQYSLKKEIRYNYCV